MNATAGVTVPVITDDMSTYDAGIAYAGAGFYIGPLKRGSKNPGSRLGDDSNLQTSRDPEIIAGWFSGTDDGIFLHCGRSGVWSADVDTPEKLHPAIKLAMLSAIRRTSRPGPDSQSGVTTSSCSRKGECSATH
jgi:hypothetical protein